MKWAIVTIFALLALMTAAYVSRMVNDNLQQQITKPEAGRR